MTELYTVGLLNTAVCRPAGLITARRYASTGISYRRVSVRLSRAGIVPKLLNVASRKQRRTIAQGL